MAGVFNKTGNEVTVMPAAGFRIALASVGVLTAATSLAPSAVAAGTAARPVLAYVLNDVADTVVPLNVTTNTFGRPVKVGIGPDAIVFSPNGKTAYVASGAPGLPLRPADTVAVIDTKTNRNGRRIKVAVHPNSLVITPNGQTVYALSPTGVTPISTATKTTGPLIKVGHNPVAMTITPDGGTIYVANSHSGTVTPISTATNKPGRPIKVGSGPDFVAVTPDGREAYVLSVTRGQQPGFNVGSVTVIRTASKTASAPIQLNGFPSDLVFTPSGKTAYVAVASDKQGVGTQVIPMSTATGKPGKPMQISKLGHGVPGQSYEAITPDGKTLWVGDWWAFKVFPVNTSTGKPGKPIGVQFNPNQIAITPDGSTVYVATGGVETTAISNSTHKIITVITGTGGIMGIDP